jgi:hypothetical protein
LEGSPSIGRLQGRDFNRQLHNTDHARCAIMVTCDVIGRRKFFVARSARAVSVLQKHRRRNVHRIEANGREGRWKSKMKNDHGPKLTGPYLSTGMEIGQSEDIILTTI